MLKSTPSTINIPPSRLYYGKKRICKRYLPKKSWNEFLWATNLKPGDYIFTCEGMNRQVAKIEISWFRISGLGNWKYYSNKSRMTNNYVIGDVIITDNVGNLHFVNGYNNCVYKPVDRNNIIHNWTARVNDESYWHLYEGWVSHTTKLLCDAIKNGDEFLDDNGVFLPKFDTAIHPELLTRRVVR